MRDAARGGSCGGAVLLAVLVFAVSACGGGVGGGERSGVRSEPGEVRCGRPFVVPAPVGLDLVARFPESVTAGGRTVSGTIEVISREAVRGVVAPAADIFLVRGGKIVTAPLPQDAVGVRWEPAAGESRILPAMASLVSCEPGGGPLAADRYELYARVVLAPDDGPTRQAFGGPWPLRVQ